VRTISRSRRRIEDTARRPIPSRSPVATTPPTTRADSAAGCLTVSTVNGDTYLVQVGGFGFFMEDDFEETAQFGRVRIRVD
jgi:hypothetical protein